MTVHSIAEPYTYKLVFRQQRESSSIMFCKKRDAIKVIKSEWWYYYSECSVVKFIEYNKPQPTQPTKLTHNTDFDISDSGKLRRSSLKNLLNGLNKKSHRSSNLDGLGSCSCLDSENSPRWLRRFSMPNLRKSYRSDSNNDIKIANDETVRTIPLAVP